MRTLVVLVQVLVDVGDEDFSRLISVTQVKVIHGGALHEIRLCIVGQIKRHLV